MRVVSRRIVAFSLALAVLGCGASPTENQKTAERLVGTWAVPFDIPGSSQVMVLATHDSVVTGTGTYSFEAGHSGTTTESGTISGSTINLDVLFDNAQLMHFRGELVSIDRLQGIWYSVPVGDPVEIEFDRVR